MTDISQPPPKLDINKPAAKSLQKLYNFARAGWAELRTPSAQLAEVSDTQLFIGDGSHTLRIGGVDKAITETSQLAQQLKSLRGQDIDLIFTGRASLDLTFNLPEGPLDELRSMIETELQYRSPFDDINAVWFWTAYETDQDHWHIDASIALKTTVEWALKAIEEAGMKVGTVMRQKSDGSISIIARPEWILFGRDVPRSKLDRLIREIPGSIRLPAICFGAFALSALALFVSNSYRYAVISSDATQARALISERASLSASAREIEARQSMSNAKLVLVGKLAELLPDGTWLDQIAIDEESMTITGYGPSAAEVTRLLSTVEGLGEIKYGSPVTRDNTQALERFRIVAEITGSAL